LPIRAGGPNGFEMSVTHYLIVYSIERISRRLHPDCQALLNLAEILAAATVAQRPRW
jgi:hypothetical protein